MAKVAERCVAANGADAPLTLCDATVDPTIYSSPRVEAGGGDPAPVNGVGPQKVGLTDDRLACDTMPIEQFVYAGRSFGDVFTPAQQASLKKTFAGGVCDYSKPGIGFADAVPWLTYQDAAGRVVYGGTPLGASPLSAYFRAAQTASPRPASGALPATGAAPAAGTAALVLLVAAGVLRRRVR